MTSIFLWVLKMSFQGSFVALVVMVFRMILKNRPKRYAYALWLVVLFRLLLPINLESSFSLMPRAVAMPVFMEDLSAEGQESVDHSRETFGDIPIEDAKADTSFALLDAATLIYGLGFALLAIHFIYSHVRLSEKMRGAKKIEEGIYTGMSIEMPFSYGVINRRIYLPSGLSSEEQEQIVAHERVHIERWDPLIKMGAYLVVLIHWFNPILWLSYILMTKDMEMSCDERALMKASMKEKQIYAKALIKISEDTPKSLPATAYSLGDVGQRLKNIFTFKKTTWKEKVIFTFIFFLLLALLLTNPFDKLNGNVERVIRDIKPVESTFRDHLESIFGDQMEVFQEGDQLVIGRLNHQIDQSFDKTKPLSMQALRREFLDETTGMMIHESLHFLPGDTIYVEDDIHEVFYDEAEDATYLTFLADDGFQESIRFKGDVEEMFGESTPKRVAFKFQVKPFFSFSDRFQILDYNEIYQSTGELPEVETFLP